MKRYRKKAGRPSTRFDDPTDQVQERLEMFRSVYQPQEEEKKTAEAAAQLCNLSKTQFFNIKKLFLEFGVFGLVGMSRGRVSKHKLTPKIETRIVDHKRSRFSHTAGRNAVRRYHGVAR